MPLGVNTPTPLPSPQRTPSPASPENQSGSRGWGGAGRRRGRSLSLGEDPSTPGCAERGPSGQWTSGMHFPPRGTAEGWGLGPEGCGSCHLLSGGCPYYVPPPGLGLLSALQPRSPGAPLLWGAGPPPGAGGAETVGRAGTLTVLSSCPCSSFTVLLSFTSCSWVVFRSSCNLVAARPRSLVNFFSFSSLSWGSEGPRG